MRWPEAYHNSQDKFYRLPFGAVAVGSEVNLKLRINNYIEGIHCQLKLFNHRGEELAGSEIKTGQDTVENAQEKTFSFNCQLPQEPGLIWYYFQLNYQGELFYYGNNPDQLGGVGLLTREEPRPYQISVFYPNEIPTWYKEGIMYQIFVDRFHRGKNYLELMGEENLKGDPTKKNALLHLNWDDQVQYFKDEEGNITKWSFFGGNLQGIIDKLDYLEELGVSILYLNPIFQAASNHKYDTADYFKIDPFFGDEKIFKKLIAETEKRGMAIILDGVFSHTGADSIYFNKEGHFPQIGAFQSKDSPYFPWFSFSQYPHQYDSWWGIDVLPNANKREASFQKFIYNDENSVVRHWLREGIKGWRLDVADELPGDFIKGIKKAVKKEDPTGVLIGEVWEDASHKVSYDELREYFWGEELDAVMNYPLRISWLNFLTGKIDGKMAYRQLMSLYENYPRENFYSNMNLISSHDRIRALTILGAGPEESSLTEEEKANYSLPTAQRELGVKRLKLLILLQMTVPGVPCIYYGDEAGMEGYSDPYNRGCYPWGQEDQELLEWQRRMSLLRKEYPLLVEGDFQPQYIDEDLYSFFRENSTEVMGVFVNRHLTEEKRVDLPQKFNEIDYQGFDLLTGEKVSWEGMLTIKIPPLGARVIYLRKINNQGKKSTGLARTAGVLLSITSLPSPWGVGDLGPGAYEFVDFLVKTKQGIWQILPLQILDEYDSPYFSISSFGGNELLLDLEQLTKLALLAEKESEAGLQELATGPGENLSYQKIGQVKDKLLRKAFARFLNQENPQLKEEFLSFKLENKFWLQDYSLFRALKVEFNYLPWTEWEQGIAKRTEASLKHYQKKLGEEMEYHKFLQFLFDKQWKKLKKYANDKGIEIMGDLPIYPAPDSCDTWVEPKLFSLDKIGNPKKIAGVPPDYFSKEGQLWGNPTYQWKEHEKTGFSWWLKRIQISLSRLDYLRLDHFRGFESYWELPSGAVTAAQGNWKKGPGKKLFEAILRETDSNSFIVEDLGFLTPEVYNLKNLFNFPGMKIFQFSWEEILKNADYDGIYYTGTHDNETLLSWYRKNKEELELVLKSLEMGSVVAGSTEKEACQELIKILYKSKAPWVIVPLQDLLGLANTGRMNTPGTTEGNWKWSFNWEQLPTDLIPWLAESVVSSNRA